MPRRWVAVRLHSLPWWSLRLLLQPRSNPKTHLRPRPLRLLLRPLGNVLYFMPPYVISDQEIDWVFDQIEIVLREVAG